jgi:hypothetical protein
MEVMSATKLLIILFLFLFSSCSTSGQGKRKNIKPIIGGVYVSNVLIQNRSISYDSITPILALRVDNATENTLLVKYRFGSEALLDSDFEYVKSCDCYSSKGYISFAPYGARRESVFLKFQSSKTLTLQYMENGDNKFFEYHFTYKDKVNSDTNRQLYYAEDGFKLFAND